MHTLFVLSLAVQHVTSPLRDAALSLRRLVAPAPIQQYFSLIPLQLQLPAPASQTIFFSHTTPTPACRTQLLCGWNKSVVYNFTSTNSYYMLLHARAHRGDRSIVAVLVIAVAREGLRHKRIGRALSLGKHSFRVYICSP